MEYISSTMSSHCPRLVGSHFSQLLVVGPVFPCKYQDFEEIDVLLNYVSGCTIRGSMGILQHKTQKKYKMSEWLAFSCPHCLPNRLFFIWGVIKQSRLCSSLWKPVTLGVLVFNARCRVHREDRESRFLSSRMAIVAAFRSWSGKHF